MRPCVQAHDAHQQRSSAQQEHYPNTGVKMLDHQGCDEKIGWYARF